jgi:hypothetical protein
MIYPQIVFQVRIRETASLVALADRVGTALRCSFSLSESEFFEGDEALEASCLGLWITLSYDRGIPKGEPRRYRLTGTVQEDLDAEWPLGFSLLSVSEYILGVLRIADSEAWYIPDTQEREEDKRVWPDDEDDDSEEG